MSGCGCAGQCQGCATIGDLLPTVVWPDDVRAYKRRLDPQFKATNATVHACTELPVGQAAAWADFYGAWQTFNGEDEPTFGAANRWAECKRYEAELVAWQALIAASCNLSAPRHDPEAGNPDTSWVKWVAGAVAVAGIVYTAGPFLHAAAKALARKLK